MNFTATKTLSVVSFLALCTLASPIYAQPGDQENAPWHFDCYPETDTAIIDTPNPNILINLDVSGSMSESAGGKITKLSVAKIALKKLIDANKKDPQVNYGFSAYSSVFKYLNPCEQGNETKLEDSIKYQNARGSTNTTAAIRGGLHTSCFTQLKDNQTAATLLITDGEPNNPYQALDQACIHREKANLFVIGLGKGTNTQYNNILAAAGGTGQCTQGDPCDIQTRYSFNQGPIYGRYSKNLRNFMQSCSGSYSADNTSNLLDAMNEISSKVACTFPLQTLTHAPKNIPLDPENEYPYIKITPKQGPHTLPPLPYAHSKKFVITDQTWTWEFANDSRTAVNLSDAACKAIRKQRHHDPITSVTTHVGCICQQEVGSSCANPDYNLNRLCPEGRWTCDRGHDICQGLGENNTTVATSKPYSCVIVGAKSHCANGEANSCTNGQLNCQPLSGPMPELCNALDDDCDGIIDNMSSSWKKPQFARHLKHFKETQNEQYKQLHAQACSQNNVCSCPNERPPLASIPKGFFTPASLSDYTYDWENRHGSCYCQAQ